MFDSAEKPTGLTQYRAKTILLNLFQLLSDTTNCSVTLRKHGILLVGVQKKFSEEERKAEIF